MKINKIIIKIQHFFGFNKETQHIDDVTVNIWCDHWSKEKRSRIGDNKDTREDADEIKSQIVEIFKTNPKLEERCSLACQVWITFYKSSDENKGGQTKMLYYSKDKTLYYPNKEDIRKWNRDQKIESIVG